MMEKTDFFVLLQHSFNEPKTNHYESNNSIRLSEAVKVGS